MLDLLGNNSWKKKYVKEKKRTASIEEEIRKVKNQIESQHRKLVSVTDLNGKTIELSYIILVSLAILPLINTLLIQLVPS